MSLLEIGIYSKFSQRIFIGSHLHPWPPFQSFVLFDDFLKPFMPYFPHILSSDCYDEKCAIHNLRDSCIVNPSIIYLIVCFIFLLRHLHWRQDFLNEARLQAHRICIFERPVFLLLLDLFGSLLVGPARASSLLPLFVVQFFFPFCKVVRFGFNKFYGGGLPCCISGSKENLIAKCTCLNMQYNQK